MKITIDITKLTNQELVELYGMIGEKYKVIQDSLQPNEKCCSKCKVVKESKSFFKDNAKKSGLSPQCKECFYKSRDIKKKEVSQKKWKEQNPDYMKTWSQSNKEKIKEYRKVFMEKNPDYYKEYREKRKKSLVE